MWIILKSDAKVIFIYETPWCFAIYIPPNYVFLRFGGFNGRVWSFRFVVLLLFLLYIEQVFEPVEVFLHYDSDSLSVEAGLRKIPVVGLVVYLYRQVAVGFEQVSYVKVADEAGVCRVGIVPVAELSVYKQPVVKQSSA